MAFQGAGTATVHALLPAQVQLRDGRFVLGMEALIRWNHPLRNDSAMSYPEGFVCMLTELRNMVLESPGMILGRIFEFKLISDFRLTTRSDNVCSGHYDCSNGCRVLQRDHSYGDNPGHGGDRGKVVETTAQAQFLRDRMKRQSAGLPVRGAHSLRIASKSALSV